MAARRAVLTRMMIAGENIALMLSRIAHSA
jgi:hypothetical protein